MRVLGISCVVGVLVAAGAAPAPAALVGVGRYGDVLVRAAPGERNAVDVWIAADGGAVLVADAGPAPLAGPGCETPRPGTVRCVPEDRSFDVDLRLGDLDDQATLRVAGAPSWVAVGLDAGDGDDRVESDGGAWLHGGAGDDVLTTLGAVAGGAGDDRLAGRRSLGGGPGDDVLRASGREDATLTGGPGRDRLRGGRGDDVLRDRDGELTWRDVHDGGPGTDRILYDDRRDRVRVDLAAGRAVMARGVVDTLRDVEDVTAGGGNDVLFGDAAANALFGGDGRDVVAGRAGDDRLSGWRGRDVLRGGAGRDGLDGSLAGDRLDGGPGADRLRAGGGRDVLVAGGGDDAGAGAGVDLVRVTGPAARVSTTHDWVSDRVRCARPARAVVAERGDRVDRGCGPVDRQPPYRLLGGHGRVRLTLSEGRVGIPIRCPDSLGDCDGRVAVRHGGRVIARDRFEGSWYVYGRATLDAAAARRVERRTRLPVTVVIRFDLGPRTFPVAGPAVIVAAKED